MAERVLNLLKAGMGRYPAVNAEVHLDTLMETCKFYFKENAAFALIEGADDGNNKQSNAIYVSDLQESETTFALLLVRGDPGRALPSFVNPATRVVKPIKAAEPGDVPGASCHLIFSKKAIAQGKDQGRHRMAMERTRGIGRALARDFLTQLMTTYAAEFPDKFIAEKSRRTKKEKPQTISYRPTVGFHAQQNGSLKKDLEEGRIAGFKLVRGNTEFEGEANEAKVERLDIQLTARIVPTENFGRVKSLIDHVRQTLNNISFEALNFELIDEAGEPLATTSTIDVNGVDDGDMRYVKTVPMTDLGDDLAECYAQFHAPILKQAREALFLDKNWT